MIDRILTWLGAIALIALLCTAAWFSWVENDKAHERSKAHPVWR